MKSRSPSAAQALSFETRRQAFHIAVGIGAALLIANGFLTALNLAVVLLIGILVSVASRRVRIPLIADLLDLFDRPADRDRFPGKGVVLMATGMLLSAALFPKSIAAAAVIILGVGDSLSTIVGIAYGKHAIFYNKRKMLEGTFAGAIFAALAASFIVSWPLAYLGSFAGMLAEALDIVILDRKIDDNILVPLAAGAVMWLLTVL